MFASNDKPLFDKVILQSGGSIVRKVGAHQDVFVYITSAVNCSSKSTANVISCLRKVNGSALIAASDEINAGYDSVVDGKYIKEHPSKLLASGSYLKVPVLFGGNTDEGSSFIPANISSSEFAAELERFKGFSESLAKLYPISDFNNSYYKAASAFYA